jgi:hypothetical protein
MKKILSIIFVITFFAACSDDVKIKNFDINSAEVIRTTKIINENEGAFFYPKFDNKNKRIFFSTANYTGIFYYDLEKKSINNLIDAKGTGLNYIVEGNEVYFVLPAINERNNRRIFSVAKQNIDSKKIDIILKSNSGIFVNDTVKFFDISNNVFVENRDIYDVTVFSSLNDRLLIYSEGELRTFAPFQNYMITNVTEADDRNLILEIAGKGVYKYSLETNQIDFLTDEIILLNMLKNSNLAVGVKQKNEGLIETKSEIFLFDILSKNLINLTAELNITALNPSFNNDGSQIAFNTMEGNIYLMSLKISEGQAL